MDSRRFDVLTRSLANGTTRNIARRAFAGGTLGALIGLLGLVADADGKRKKRRKRGKRKKGRPSDPPPPPSPPSPPSPPPLPPGCPASEELCDGRCVDPRVDDDNCGACDNACSVDEVCVDGICSCPSDFEPCLGACVPLGDCCAGIACPVDTACAGGICVCADPERTLCDERCVDVATDGANCGACDAVCGTGDCSNGACLCAIIDDCPAPDCACGARKEGGFACFRSGSTAGSCTVDGDCPNGSFCFVTGFCAPPCLD